MSVWLACALFSIGLYGVLTRREIVAVLASVEVMLGAALLALVSLVRMGNLSADAQASGQALGVVIVAMAAAEASVGLALVIALARRSGRTEMDELTEVAG